MIVMSEAASFRIDPATLDFELPEELIAQAPNPRRDQARLLVADRRSGRIFHRTFSEIGDFIEKGAVLVLNKARVNPAKVMGRKETGGRVEVIFIAPAEAGLWRALVRPFLRDGTVFTIGPDTRMKLESRTPNGECVLRWEKGAKPEELMAKEGKIPLPPYIKRLDKDPRDSADHSDYQTVYASVPGSIAAPTAGLHFSKELLGRIKRDGRKILEVLLHVGWGTFRPISGPLHDHEMLPESYEVSPGVCEKMERARREGRRIVAVGTTSTRVLESLPEDPSPSDLRGATNLFITPGHVFKRVSGLITNFHVPRSTPLALTAAFLGIELLERAYQDAIKKGYRFFSYVDAMLVL